MTSYTTYGFTAQRSLYKSVNLAIIINRLKVTVMDRLKTEITSEFSMPVAMGLGLELD